VPVDDTNCYWYSMFTSFGAPIDKAKMREQRLREHRLPDYAPLKNRANNYGYDPEEQDNLTYTGMGLDINVHDQWAVESMGAIQDRRDEHLGRTDVGIIANRRKLRSAIADLAGDRLHDLPMNAPGARPVTGPVSIDTIAPTDVWQGAWPRADAERRAACSWNAVLPDE